MNRFEKAIRAEKTEKRCSVKIALSKIRGELNAQNFLGGRICPINVNSSKST
ncbi:MAG: hypothetical protein IBX45_13715 [Campylobacterales bacterium]|nr:hypothetical protein [Campylobacterales bacterium]